MKIKKSFEKLNNKFHEKRISAKKQAQPWNLKVPLKWSISPSKQFFNTTGSDQSNQFPQLRYSMNLKWSLPAAMKLLPIENNFTNKRKYVCLCIQLHLFWQWPWKENPPNIYIDQINAKIIFMVKSNKDCVYLLLAQGKNYTKIPRYIFAPSRKCIP